MGRGGQGLPPLRVGLPRRAPSAAAAAVSAAPRLANFRRAPRPPSLPARPHTPHSLATLPPHCALHRPACHTYPKLQKKHRPTKAMASALATTPLRRAGAAAPSRGAAQVARVVPNKKALSYDSGWKKVRGGDWGGHVRVRARTEGAVGGRRAGVERAERARALRGARPPPPLLSSRPLSNLSLSHPSLSPPPLHSSEQGLRLLHQRLLPGGQGDPGHQLPGGECDWVRARRLCVPPPKSNSHTWKKKNSPPLLPLSIPSHLFFLFPRLLLLLFPEHREEGRPVRRRKVGPAVQGGEGGVDPVLH